MRNVRNTASRHFGVKLLPRAICVALAGLSVMACDVYVETKNAETDAIDNSLDSSGMVMPAATHGVATIRLPEALLVEAMRPGNAPAPQPGAGSNGEAVVDGEVAVGPNLDAICLQGRGQGETERDGSRDGIRRIRDMEGLIHGITLKATLDAGGEKIVELKKDVRCRDLVLLLQNLPVDRKMTLSVEFGNERLAFSGTTREFSFDGKQTVGLKVPLERLDVTNDRPRILPVGIVLFRDTAAQEVRGIVGDQASRIVCDSESKRCRVAGNEIEADKAARLTDIMKSQAEKSLETGALGRLLAVHQLRCDDTECTGFPLTLR